MKKRLVCILALALLLALCACGEDEIKVELPAGLHFGMTPEEVETQLGKADMDTRSGPVYFVDYSSRPKGFDSESKLSPHQIYLLIEYTDGKLSKVSFSFDLSKDKSPDLDRVILQAESYYTQKLGDPKRVNAYSGSNDGMTWWTEGQFELSILTSTEGGMLPRRQAMLSFRYGEEK